MQNTSFGPKVSFFFISFVFFVLTNAFRFYICFDNITMVWVGGSDENGLKRVVWAHGKFFLYIFVFFGTN
jgi:hypothetical protein